jgi:hypothetical protein
MLRSFTALILALILFSCNPVSNKEMNDWIQINNKDYSLQILSGYKSSKENIDPSAFGRLSQNFLSYRNPKLQIKDLGLKLLEFHSFEIPKQFNSRTSDWILDTCTQYFLDKEYAIISGGRLLGKQDILLNGFRGKSIKAIVDVGKEDSLVVFQKLFVAHSRVYILCANGYKENIDKERIEHFMSSFSLKN